MSKELHKAAVTFLKKECKTAQKMAEAEVDQLSHSRTELQKANEAKAVAAARLKTLDLNKVSRVSIGPDGLEVLPEALEPIHLYAAFAMHALMSTDTDGDMSEEDTTDAAWRMALAMDAAKPETD